MILQVVATTRRRGAEVFATQLATALDGTVGPVRTVAIARGGDDGLDVPVLGPGGRVGALVALRGPARSARVVVGHGSTSLPTCALATAGLPVPFVYRSIGDPGWWTRGRVRRARTLALLRRARMVVAVFTGGAETLVRDHGLPRDRVRVIPNAVPAEAFPMVTPAAQAAARRRLGLADETPVVLYLGALAPEKNVGAAIDAVASTPGAHLVVAGDGPLRDHVADHLRRRLPGRSTLLGSTADPAGTLALADLLVLPSLTEGCPAVLIEAGLSGLPVVASDVGGVSEVVVHGETGVLVPPGDVAAITSAVRRVLRTPSDMGPAARARCLERFDLAGVAREWAGLIEEVAA